MRKASHRAFNPAHAALLRDSGAVDVAWYLHSYPDVRLAGVDPVLHYLTCGASEGRYPNQLFDTRWYVRRYKIGKQNPLVDFMRHSVSKKRDPNPFFSTAYYLRRNPDVARAGVIPLIHFIQFGAAEGRDPSPAFSTHNYLERNPGLVPVGENPLAHFLHVGRNAGIQPIPVGDGPVLEALPWQRWMDPAWVGDQRSARWDRRLRLAAFALGCVIYARRRNHRPEIVSCGRSMAPWDFVRLAVCRFGKDSASSTAFNRAVLLANAFPSANRSNYAARILASPAAGLMLFTANGLKAEGFFDDAEAICHDMIRAGWLRDLALLTLGDLYLVQAVWASEYHAYAIHGAAINPDELLGLDRRRTWHDRTLSEAVEVLGQAAAENPDSADAWSTLALAKRLSEDWSGAISSNERVVALHPSRHGETDLARARAVFGLHEAAGYSLFEHAIGGSAHRLFSGVAKIIEDPVELSSTQLLALKPAASSTHVFLSYKLIGSGTCVGVRQTVTLPPEHLVELGDANLLPEYGAVLVGGDTLLAGASHMRRCHDATFTSGLEAVANGNAIYCVATPIPAPVPIACFIGNNTNYFHWLLEDVPRIEQLVSDPAYAHLPILTDRNVAPWQVELTRRLGVSEARLCRVDFTRPVSVRHLVLPPRLSKNLVVHPHAVAFLRDRLVPHASELEPKPGKRLYLTRKTALVQRGLINEPDIFEYLRRAGFIAVDPGSLSIDEQIKLFSDAEIIASPGGAALSNILFAPRTAKVLALSADAILSETFTSLASALGQTYVLCTGASYPHAHRQWIWTRFDFSISNRDIELGLEQILR